MTGVLAGFVTIGSVIGLGALIAHLRLIDEQGQVLLSRVAFFVANPALMITVLGGTPVTQLFSANLVASISSVVTVSVIYVLAARLVFRRTPSEVVIGTFSAAYVNAGNLGLPIAAYVLGDVSLIAPMLLTQLLVLQPAGLAVLDLTSRAASGTAAESARARVLRLVTQPFRNPLMISSLLGLVISVTGFRLPRLVADPLHLVGGMAVPMMLIAYGVSLRLGPRPGRGEPPVQVGLAVGLKLVVQPLIAWAVGALLLDLSRPALLAVTVVAALPTAQNVFTFAVRYRHGTLLARDAIFFSTVLSVPVLVIIAALLG
ncbi:hypothetical protein FHX74_003036 [Friedmanniella endophytica]|uniref:AEC family transporter n=1 Tax=Microlunatus kandeliicorticis TaxID=1759536 RepID=A0A7W3IUK4_9ACTN|nr:AEC family transporter [Microlunatus kandeliicorticis]MBA8795400.1 hypothetical protein [Microlunatus kandeliicorticis]